MGRSWTVRPLPLEHFWVEHFQVVQSHMIGGDPGLSVCWLLSFQSPVSLPRGHMKVSEDVVSWIHYVLALQLQMYYYYVTTPVPFLGVETTDGSIAGHRFLLDWALRCGLGLHSG